jgi:hypothetical protein
MTVSNLVEARVLTKELDRGERAEQEDGDPTHADRQVATQDLDLVLESGDLLP